MPDNTIQIKRSYSNDAPVSLANGELAYSFTSNNLFIGANSDANVVIKIAGGSDVALLNVTPGELQNGAALVVNSTGGIDTLTIGAFSVTSSETESLNASANVDGNNFNSTHGVFANTLTANIANLETIQATDITVNNSLTVDGDIVLRGDSLTLGDGGDVLTLGSSVNSHVIPYTNSSFDLGTSTYQWRHVFANQITLSADPTGALDVATKQYVDNIEAQLGGNSIIIGPSTDGVYANGSGVGNVEGAVTSLANSTSIADAIDKLNEVVLNTYNNTYVRDIVATCTSGNTGGAPLTSTLTLSVVGNANRYDIDWGDGSWTNNTTDSTPSHTYTDNTNSPFDVVVYAKNTDALGEGNVASFTATDLITLYTGDPNADFDLYLVASGGSEITEANVNETVYLDNETTNANGVTATFHVNWGDGSTDSIASTSASGGTEGTRLGHTYTSGTGTGTDTITLAINTHSTANPAALPDTASKTIKIFDTSIGAPEGLSGKTFNLTSGTTGNSPRLAFGHIDNSSESSSGTDATVTRYTSSGSIQTSGQANSQVTYDAAAGTLSAIVDGSADGAITFDSSDNTGTNQSLVVVDELDFYNFDDDGDSVSAANRRYAPGLYSGFRARISKSSLTTGLHTYKLSHSTTGNTSILEFVKDNLTNTPTISMAGASVTQNSAGTLAYVSGVPYYTNDAVLNVSGVTVTDVSGQTYRNTSSPFDVTNGTNVESDSGSAFNFQNKGYAILPSSFLNNGYPKANVGMDSAVSIDQFQIDVAGGGRCVEGFQMRMENVNGNGSYVNYGNTNIQAYNGNSSGVREDSIPVSDSLGSTFDTDGVRISAFSSTNATPTFDSSTDYYATTAWSGAVTVAGTDEAIQRYGNLQHYTTDLSSGYLPAGPDLATGRSGAQYFRFALKRQTVANFNLILTGKVSGVFVAAPGTDIDNASGQNGWLDCSVAYGGAGTPGSDTSNGGNGSDGCAFNSGQRIVDGTTYSNQTFQMTLGDQNLSSSYNNQLLVSIKLESGDYLTKLEVS